MLRRAVNAFLRLILACAHERRGQVALTFGLSALPALIMVGSAIDYSRAVTQRSNLQQATDSTVLAMTHTYLNASATCSGLYAPTQTYLSGTMNTPAPASQPNVVAACAGAGAITITGGTGVATLQSIIISQNNTQMCIKTTMVVPTQMMTIVNIPTMTVGAYSCSQVGGTYEVALVLDNSFSMSESLGSQTKMQALQTAATDLVNTLIPTTTAAPTAAISIVPFNALVNVGKTVAGSTPPAFMDTSGQSSLNWRIIGKPSWATSRFDLFKTLNTAWLGCVEERPNNQNTFYTGAPDTTNYLTKDIPATTGDSLFVPYFAPDEPGGVNTQSSWYWDGYDPPDQNRNNYFLFSNSFSTYQNCNSFDPTKNSKGACTSSQTPVTFSNSYINDMGYQGSKQTPKLNNACAATDWANDMNANNPYPGSGLSLACKYQSSALPSPAVPQWFGLSVGPNSNCSTPAITPLSTTPKTLTDAISAMQPTGLTNLATGFMWGWRTISGMATPSGTQYPPFFPVSTTNVTSSLPTGWKIPLAYTPPFGKGPPSNAKVIVFMTDGYNTWAPHILTSPPSLASSGYGISSNLLSAYETFGYMSENRLSNYSTTPPAAGATVANTGSNFYTNPSTFRAQMDNVMLEACTNAKAQGITVYTVGFSTPQTPIDQDGVNLLKDCASTTADAYIAADGTDIDNAFKQIAVSITNLRLSQ